jgi:spore maturation protein CgeB
MHAQSCELAAPVRAGTAPTLLIGNGGHEHVGAHLLHAAEELGLPVSFVNISDAYTGSAIHRKVNWWVRGHRPARLREFSEKVLEQCRSEQAGAVLTTGLAPLHASILQRLGGERITRINFLTDDPWNPAHRALWFMKALPLYDFVFTPRRANIEDLRRLGCRIVQYLPFGYSSQVHFPEAASAGLSSDVLFAGGADPDRVPWISALLRQGISVGLYGGYWDRYSETREHARGNADPPTLRRAAAATKVALCLVRRANRDGHAMRTFEIPAMKACMVVEKTQDHLELFGPEGNAVLYFDSIPEMVEKVRWLLQRPEERHILAENAYRLVVEGGHTYRHRLQTMLAQASGAEQ